MGRFPQPLCIDYAEYRDQAFLDLLDVSLPTRPLASFWPRGGPQWGAPGRAESGEAILVEAKAHLNELNSPATGASAESSLAQIEASLAETAQGLGVPAGYDWSKQFYQYANRLAHAYLLDRLNGIPTRLVFLYLIGDTDVGGPTTRAAWDAAIENSPLRAWPCERATVRDRRAHRCARVRHGDNLTSAACTVMRSPHNECAVQRRNVSSRPSRPS